MKILLLPMMVVICLVATPALAGSSEAAALSLALVVTAVCVAFRAGRRHAARAAIRRCP